MLGEWHSGKLIQIIQETSTTKRFWFELNTTTDFPFKAGQFMTFDLPIHERRNKRWRSYSIASAPDGGNVLEFVIVSMEGGAGTRYLFEEADIGTVLPMRGPQGHFILPDTLDMQTELCFICTGTGIAPFRSMLLDIKNRQCPHPPIHLIFGTRYRENILYCNEMKSWQDNLHLQCHIALSRELSPEWSGHKGYVHSLYEQLYANVRPANFYLCGWQDMLDEARTRLQMMGYEKKHIFYESYG